MNRNNMGIEKSNLKTLTKQSKMYPVPLWVPKTITTETELCPDCFKVVGERSRYNLVCTLGKTTDGMSVGELTDTMNLKQPTITHHLQVLESVNAVKSSSIGRTKIYTLNREAHCFLDCKIPY